MPGRKDKVVVSIHNMLRGVSSSSSNNPTIYEVDQTLRQGNERAYDPGVVAIGPIHRNKGHLKAMEQLKVSYLHQLLQRKKDTTVETYVLKLRKFEKRARKCYSNLIQLPQTDEFVEMLLLDGIFVVVLLRKLHGIEGWKVENEYIFHSDQVYKRVATDLLLVENQLPFFILSELFHMTKSNGEEDNLSNMVLKRLSWVLPWKHHVDFVDPFQDKNHLDDHLLGMVHRAYFPRKAAKEESNSKKHSTIFETINTISELDEMGISFKMVEGVTMDVRFTSNKVIQVSQLTIEDYTETMLKNFIAYEQMHPNIQDRYVSDYSLLMTYLVHSSKDVKILRRAGIYENMLGDDETVHLMFNQLGRNVMIDRSNFCYTDVSESANKHCSRRHNEWMAKLKRNYFNSPWSILSVVAAIILLLLTTTQTVFTILPYL